ncbi:MAG: hypothetical protein Ta2G_05010 [Termitinemataceae bacterium]|nr:MAG: hypothetical protein Ta2G_05010 [Termitinemataceae bacterium]
MQRCLCFFLGVLFLSCKTLGLTYTPVSDAAFSSSLGIINIEDFEKIALKTKGRTVYYTDEYFFVVAGNITYSHISRGYKTIREYKEGKLSVPQEWSIFRPGYSD